MCGLAMGVVAYSVVAGVPAGPWFTEDSDNVNGMKAAFHEDGANHFGRQGRRPPLQKPQVDRNHSTLSL